MITSIGPEGLKKQPRSPSDYMGDVSTCLVKNGRLGGSLKMSKASYHGDLANVTVFSCRSEAPDLFVRPTLPWFCHDFVGSFFTRNASSQCHLAKRSECQHLSL